MRAFEFMQQNDEQNNAWLYTKPKINSPDRQEKLISFISGQKQQWLIAILQRIQRDKGRSYTTKADAALANRILDLWLNGSSPTG